MNTKSIYLDEKDDEDLNKMIQEECEQLKKVFDNIYNQVIIPHLNQYLCKNLSLISIT